jgi:hypothetical protein
VLDRKLPFARTGRIWPYYCDKDHPVILYDYTPTRERAGPEKFLQGYRGYLQADAYGGYDAFFKDPARGLVEVGCMAHARRHFRKALESDQTRMGPVLLLIAQLYRVEKQARSISAEDRLRLRQLQAKPILNKLHQYLLELDAELLPKSPQARAVRYALKNWAALTRYSEDGNLEIGRVEMWRGGLGWTYLLPAFRFRCLTSPPMLRFHIPLVKPDVRSYRIRLSPDPSNLRARQVSTSRQNAIEAKRLIEVLVRDLGEPGALPSCPTHQPAAEPSFGIGSNQRIGPNHRPLIEVTTPAA